jgi:hypothetical protein
MSQALLPKPQMAPRIETGLWCDFFPPHPQCSHFSLQLNLITLIPSDYCSKFPHAYQTFVFSFLLIGIFQLGFQLLFYYYFVGDFCDLRKLPFYLVTNIFSQLVLKMSYGSTGI